MASIFEINKQFGPFEAAIGYSVGGMSLINTVKSGLKTNHIILIRSGDIVQNILDSFVVKLGLDSSISKKLRLHFENKYNEDMGQLFSL